MLGPRFDEVLAAAQTGDQHAIAILYRDLNPAISAYLSSRARQHGEDLAQDTWLAAAPGLPGFTGDEAGFRAWMFTIAHRRLIDHWRRSRPTRDLALGAPGVEAQLVATDAEDRLELAAAVQELVAGLTPEQVEIVLLRVVAGLSVDEVAGVVGKRPGTVRVIQHRALRKVAGRLSRTGVTQ